MLFYKFCFYFMLFLIYSVAGWIMEVIVVAWEKKKFVNRGFFIGPYCPIYGVSVILMSFILGRYSNDPFVLFILSMVLCSFFEYVTGFIMEKLFKARWWDYSDKTFNINGRVCLENSVIFGILGCVVIIWVNPFLENLLYMIPESILICISSILLIAFLIDNIVSFKIISKFSSYFSADEKDNTEEINEKVKDAFKKKSFFTKRLTEAFPNVKSILPEIKAKYEEQKRKLKEKIR